MGRLTQLARDIRKRAPSRRIWIWMTAWQAAMILKEIPAEGYSVIGGKFHVLRKGPCLAALLCYAPPTPEATVPEIRAALEHKLSEVVASYPGDLAAEVEHLKTIARARGIVLPGTSSSEMPSDDMEITQ